MAPKTPKTSLTPAHTLPKNSEKALKNQETNNKLEKYPKNTKKSTSVQKASEDISFFVLYIGHGTQKKDMKFDLHFLFVKNLEEKVFNYLYLY